MVRQGLMCAVLTCVTDPPCCGLSGSDRTTTIGQLISAYLEKKSDLEDHAVHLLFSANRWELV